MIVVKRKWGYGDVIAASTIVRKVESMGFKAALSTVCADLFTHDKLTIVGEDVNPNIDLMGKYCHFPHDRHMRECIWEVMAEYFKTKGIDVGPLDWSLPELVVTNIEQGKMLERMRGKPAPWTVLIPEANAYKKPGNRNIDRDIWLKAASAISGTVFNCGVSAFGGIPHLSPEGIRDVMSAISVADRVLTVDTGPMYMASAFRKPMVVTQGPFLIKNRLTPLDRYTVIGKLWCNNCNVHECPVHEDPVCRYPSWESIAEAVMRL